MKRIPYAASTLFLAIALAPGARAALPGNSAEGKRLHDANCTGCHDTRLYTRKDRSVRSLDGLKQQLENCSHMAGKQFSTIETQNLIKYLNDTFYQFR
jgi:mono/diheme cytochrome c family protein